MRVLIADDHAVLRKGLKEILADEFPRTEFGETGSTQKTIDLLHQKRWDVLVLDINMPGRSGLEVLREARQNFPKLPVLVLSSTPEDQLGLRVLKAGAAGFLNKQTALEELVQAVQKVLAGGKYVSAKMAEKLAAEVGRSEKAPHDQLSDREFQVMQMIASGRSLKEIAAELSLSVKTISTFRGRVIEKLNVQNTVELAHYARTHGLLPEQRP
jgi:two-component system, NarL family, invasion response regulator UvrY